MSKWSPPGRNGHEWRRSYCHASNVVEWKFQIPKNLNVASTSGEAISCKAVVPSRRLTAS